MVTATVYGLQRVPLFAIVYRDHPYLSSTPRRRVSLLSERFYATKGSDTLTMKAP